MGNDMKKLLFGTTALVGAFALATPALSGELKLPGKLDLTIRGTADFGIEWADGDFNFGRGPTDPATIGASIAGEDLEGLDFDDIEEGDEIAVTVEAEEEQELGDPRELFFNQDAEIVFRADGVGDATGIRYGANLELELDTSDFSNANWDELWIYFQNSWGEFRFGNEDSVVDILNINGSINNAGTGGLDGNQRTVGDPKLTDDGEATKVLYFTPVVAGFQGGVSYSINSDDFGESVGTTEDREDNVAIGANWQGAIGPVTGGIFAGWSRATASEDDMNNWQVGAEIGFAGFSLAGSYADETSEVTDRSGFWNVGLGTEFAGVGTSFGYQFDNVADGDGQQQYVLSADTPILPGVALRGDVAYVENFGGIGGNDGMNALVELRVAF